MGKAVGKRLARTVPVSGSTIPKVKKHHGFESQEKSNNFHV